MPQNLVSGFGHRKALAAPPCIISGTSGHVSRATDVR